MMTINSDNYGIIPYTKTITHDSLGHTVYIIKTKFNNKTKNFWKQRRKIQITSMLILEKINEKRQ